MLYTLVYTLAQRLNPQRYSSDDSISCKLAFLLLLLSTIFLIQRDDGPNDAKPDPFSLWNSEAQSRLNLG